MCGDPDHWAPSCPNRYDKRHPGKGGKTTNVVIGDTDMKDDGYGIFPTILSVCHSPDWLIETGANVHVCGDISIFFVLSDRRDFNRADGQRFKCICSWCWHGRSEVYFGEDRAAEERALCSLHQ